MEYLDAGTIVPLRTGLPEGAAVHVAIRPNRLVLGARRGVPTVSGRMVHKENLGSDLFLYIDLPGAADHLIVRYHPADAGAARIGEDHAVGLPLDQLLLFDAAGARRRRRPHGAPISLHRAGRSASMNVRKGRRSSGQSRNGSIRRKPSVS